MFVLSAFADEINSAFDKQLQGLLENAIDYIELRNVDGCNIADVTDSHLAQIINKLRNCSIFVSAIGSPLGKANADINFDIYSQKVERVCSIADALDCECIRIFSFYKPSYMDDELYKTSVFDKVETMLRVAEKYNKTLCLENEAGLYGESPEKCAELLRYFNGALRCVFDMGNFRLQGYDPFPDAYNMLKEYIQYFHIKDGFDHGAIVPPGCGDAKIRDVLSAYASEFKRDCFVSVEPHLMTFEGLDKLTKQEFMHEFVYPSKAVAFADAVGRLRTIIE